MDNVVDIFKELDKQEMLHKMKIESLDKSIASSLDVLKTRKLESKMDKTLEGYFDEILAINGLESDEDIMAKLNELTGKLNAYKENNLKILEETSQKANLLISSQSNN